MLRAWRAAEGRGRVARLNGLPTEGRSGPARGLQGSGARAGASGVQLGGVMGGLSRKRGPRVRGTFLSVWTGWDRRLTLKKTTLKGCYLVMDYPPAGAVERSTQTSCVLFLLLGGW